LTRPLRGDAISLFTPQKEERAMNEMRAINSKPDVPYDYFGAANEALENLKCFLANQVRYEEAFSVSEIIRDLDRTRHQYVQRNHDPL
jgi:hypothetical protein